MLLCPWDFPDKNTGVGCYILLQGIFPTQGSNPHLLHWQVTSLPLSHQRSVGSLAGVGVWGAVWNHCATHSVVTENISEVILWVIFGILGYLGKVAAKFQVHFGRHKGEFGMFPGKPLGSPWYHRPKLCFVSRFWRGQCPDWGHDE